MQLSSPYFCRRARPSTSLTNCRGVGVGVGVGVGEGEGVGVGVGVGEGEPPLALVPSVLHEE